jgi:hypothetical protein
MRQSMKDNGILDLFNETVNINGQGETAFLLLLSSRISDAKLLLLLLR